MKTLGIILVSAGILIGFYALTMDVDVAVNYPSGNSYGMPSRVNNLGLISDRQNYLIIASILTLARILYDYLYLFRYLFC
jgi:hypothetical protein